MVLRGFIVTLVIIAAALGVLERAANATMTAQSVRTQQALDQLTIREHRTLTQAIITEAGQGSSVALPAPTPVPLCAPGVSPCHIEAKVSFAAAGSTTGVVASGGLETAYNLAQLIGDQRWVVNETVTIVSTDPSCGSNGCLLGQRTTPIAFRHQDAYPYVADAGIVPTSSVTQGSAGSGTSGDYAGCNGATGCGNIPSGSSTPDPRSLVPAPSCTTSAYGGCTVSTPPPSNVTNKNFTNSDIPG